MRLKLYLLLLFLSLYSFDVLSQDGSKIIIKDGKYGMTTTYNGKTVEIIKPKLEDIKHLYNYRIYIYKQNGKWGIFTVYPVKHEVYQVGTPEFDEIIFLKELQHAENGYYLGPTAYIMAKKNELIAFLYFPIDEAAKTFTISPYFNEIGTTPDSIKTNFKKLFYVKKDSLYGVYNARGIQKQPVIFEKHEQYQSSSEKNVYYHILYKNNTPTLLVDNQANNPIFNANKIWFDQNIYIVNSTNDTLTYQRGRFESIKLKND